MNLLSFIWLKEWKQIYSEGGLKLLISKKGWLVAVALFMFFLMKGLMWLFIPYLIAKGIL
tara:strand:- start:467 stop:646 length:180 start_codon:yes stop_codon:yes gene_type:complete